MIGRRLPITYQRHLVLVELSQDVFTFNVLDLPHNRISVVYPGDLDELLREICLVIFLQNVLVRLTDDVADLTF